MIHVAAPLLVEVGPEHFLNLSLVAQIRPDRDALRIEFAVPLPPALAEAEGGALHYELLEGAEAERLRAFLARHGG